MNAWAAVVMAVLVVHVVWILWTVFGTFLTRGRLWLAIFHLASLGWGITVEIGPWPCPLTLAEEYLKRRAGMLPFQGGFLVHYLDAIIYPNLPVMLVAWTGVAICAANLLIYAHRLWEWRRSGRHL